MKNKILYLFTAIISLSLILVPNNVKAKVEASGLVEAVEEEIELFKNEESYKELVEQLENTDLSDYEESDDKVNVYLFRGSTCSHCFDSIVYFSSIAKDYGKYFNLKSYEVWSNTDNSNLMQKVADKMGDDVSGVPYIVIGKKSWSGFSDEYSDEIKEAIKNEYDKKSDERYDVVNELNVKDANSNTSDIIAVIVIILVTGAIVGGVIFARKKSS